jgi:hypothetical protein
MMAPNIALNRLEFQRYLMCLERIAPRLTARKLMYARPRRWLDVLLQGFLVWYGVLVAGLCVALGMRGCG